MNNKNIRKTAFLIAMLKLFSISDSNISPAKAYDNER